MAGQYFPRLDGRHCISQDLHGDILRNATKRVEHSVDHVREERIAFVVTRG